MKKIFSFFKTNENNIYINKFILLKKNNVRACAAFDNEIQYNLHQNCSEHRVR